MTDRLYVVDVNDGGTFLYDTLDVGRFATRMAEQGDDRPFTVKPCTGLRRWLVCLAIFRDRIAALGDQQEPADGR